MRDVHGVFGKRLPVLQQFVAIAAQQVHYKLRRGILHGDRWLREVPAHMHPVRVPHELHSVRQGPVAAERRMPYYVCRWVSSGKGGDSKISPSDMEFLHFSRMPDDEQQVLQR